MQFQLACTAVHFWQLVVLKKNVEIFERQLMQLVLEGTIKDLSAVCDYGIS